LSEQSAEEQAARQSRLDQARLAILFIDCKLTRRSRLCPGAADNTKALDNSTGPKNSHSSLKHFARFYLKYLMTA